jgi:hypothetical protein
MALGLFTGIAADNTTTTPILDYLGIEPDLAASMTRDLVSYSGSYYAVSGGNVTTVYDQSANGRNLTSDGNADIALTGTGNSARAVFVSSGSGVYSVLSTGVVGGSFPAGGHDVFIVMDPTTTTKQAWISDTSSPATDMIVMQYDNGSAAVSSAMTAGDLRVNDSVLDPQTRGELHDTMTASGTNVLSVEDLVLSTLDSTVHVGAKHSVWRLEGSFAEFIITPPLSDADHSAIVSNIRAFYG